MADRERFSPPAVTITDATIDSGFPAFVEITFSVNISTWTNNGVAGTLATSGGVEPILTSSRTAVNKLYLNATDNLTPGGLITLTAATTITFVGGATLSLPTSATLHT